MPRRFSQGASASRPSARTEVERFARRMDRVEALTRVFCIIAGLLLGAGAVVFFLGMVRIGGRAVTAGVLGAIFIGCAAAILLQRGLTGRDPDAQSFGNLRSRRWY